MNRRIGAKLMQVLQLTSAALDSRMLDRLLKRQIWNWSGARWLFCYMMAFPYTTLSPAQVRAVTEQFIESNDRFDDCSSRAAKTAVGGLLPLQNDLRGAMNAYFPYGFKVVQQDIH